jgi:hypothetical protein
MNRRWTEAVAAALVAACVVTSCGPPKPGTVRDVRDLPPGELRARMQSRDAALVSMTGQGSVSFESPEAAGSAYFALSLIRPDSLLLKLEGPFGIDMGFFFLSREKFVMYSRVGNRAVMGNPSAGTLRGVIPVDITPDEIVQAFSGSFMIPAAAPVAYVMEDERIRAEYLVQDLHHTYWIDPDVGDLVVRYEVRDTAGRLLIESSASSIAEHNGIPAPAHVTVSFPERGQRLSIHYTSMDINEGTPPFRYAVPGNARITIR